MPSTPKQLVRLALALAALGSPVGADPPSLSGLPSRVPALRLQNAVPSTFYPLALSRDGRMAAVGSWECVNVWDLRSKTMRQLTLKIHIVPHSLALSDDGATLAEGDNGVVQVWDVATGTLRATLQVTPVEHAYDVNSVALTGDGRLLAADDSEGGIQVWDVHAAKRLRVLRGVRKPSEVTDSLAFATDARTLAAGSDYGRAEVWDAVSGVVQVNLTEPPTVPGSDRTSVAFSADGRQVQTSDMWAAKVWDRKTGRLLRTVRFSDAKVPGASPPDRNHLLEMSRLIFLPPVLLSPSGGWAASQQEDGSIALWDVGTGAIKVVLCGKTVPDLGGGGVRTILFTPDGRRVAALTDAGLLELWDLPPDAH